MLYNIFDYQMYQLKYFELTLNICKRNIRTAIVIC